MKQKILILITIFVGIITGCELNNTPTSKVEELLGKYQGLDDSISTSYVGLTNEENLDSKYQERFGKLVRKQYRNLTYEIKEEEIDGNSATVTTKIEVLNYKEVLDKYSSDDAHDDVYYSKVLDDLEDVKDKITYTIDFKVYKNKKGTWNLEPLTEEEKQKLLGIN